jgi:hypothetical protein
MCSCAQRAVSLNCAGPKRRRRLVVASMQLYAYTACRASLCCACRVRHLRSAAGRSRASGLRLRRCGASGRRDRSLGRLAKVVVHVRDEALGKPPTRHPRGVVRIVPIDGGTRQVSSGSAECAAASACSARSTRRIAAAREAAALCRFHMRSQRSIRRLQARAPASPPALPCPAAPGDLRLQVQARARTTTAAAWAAACWRPLPARRAAAGSPQPCALHSASKTWTAERDGGRLLRRSQEMSTGLPHAGQQLGVRAPRRPRAAARGSAEGERQCGVPSSRRVRGL